MFQQASISTALPTIIKDLGGDSSFIWVGSAYALCATAIIPFMGSMAEVDTIL
jgi:MFS family permease